MLHSSSILHYRSIASIQSVVDYLAHDVIGSAQHGNIPQSLSIARIERAGPKVRSATMRTPIRFIKKPGITMSVNEIRPVANAIALGGVAIGSMNASDAARAPGSM